MKHEIVITGIYLSGGGMVPAERCRAGEEGGFLISRDRRETVFVWVFFIALRAMGQTSGNVDRQALVEQAQNAADAGDHDRALSLATRAGEIRMTPSLRLFIAEEQSAVGQYADSMSNAELCAREADEDRALKNRQRIVQQCRSLTGKLEKAAARLIVLIPDPVPPRVEVSVNSRVMEQSLFAKPYYLSPGKIHVQATAPGYKLFDRDLILVAGEEATVSVTMSPDLTAPQALQPPPVEKPEPAPVMTTTTEAGSKGGSIGPYIVLGAGAASAGAGVLFLILRSSAINDLEKLCSGPNHTVCPDTPQAHSLRDKASTDSMVANVALGVGAAALVGGTIWLILDKTQSSKPPGRAQLQVIPTNGGAVIGIRGGL